MQNRQSGRRRRSSGPNGRTMGQSMGGQSSNRLDVRVRGNANQLLEKYKQMARDSHQSGDRVAAEYYLQHADHYFRVLNDSRIRQEEMRARRGVFDQFEDEPAAIDAEAAGDQAATADAGRRQAPSAPPRQADPARHAAAEAAAVKPQVLELHLSDGEAALMAFGGAPTREPARESAREPAEDAAAAPEGEAVAKPRRRGRPRKVATPVED